MSRRSLMGRLKDPADHVCGDNLGLRVVQDGTRLVTETRCGRCGRLGAQGSVSH